MSERGVVESVLRELHEARVAGDLERLCGLFRPDALLRIAGTSDGKPISVEARGIDEIRSWLAMLVKTFKLSDYRRLSITIDGERAAVHWRVQIRSRITGQAVSTELVDLLQIQAGRIAQQVEFFVPGAA